MSLGRSGQSRRHWHLHASKHADYAGLRSAPGQTTVTDVQTDQKRLSFATAGTVFLQTVVASAFGATICRLDLPAVLP